MLMPSAIFTFQFLFLSFVFNSFPFFSFRNNYKNLPATWNSWKLYTWASIIRIWNPNPAVISVMATWRRRPQPPPWFPWPPQLQSAQVAVVLRSPALDRQVQRAAVADRVCCRNEELRLYWNPLSFISITNRIFYSAGRTHQRRPLEKELNPVPWASSSMTQFSTIRQPPNFYRIPVQINFD